MESWFEKRKKHAKIAEKHKNIEQARVKIKQLKEEIVVCEQCKQEAIVDNEGAEYITYFSRHIKEKQQEIRGLKDSIIGYSPIKHNAFAVSVLAFIGIMLLFFLSMASTNNITGHSIVQMNYTVNNSNLINNSVNDVFIGSNINTISNPVGINISAYTTTNDNNLNNTNDNNINNTNINNTNNNLNNTNDNNLNNTNDSNISNTNDMNLLNVTSNTSDFVINRNLQLIAGNIMPLNYSGAVVSSDDFVFDNKKETSFLGYKYSNTGNFIISSIQQNSCNWYPDNHPKKDLKTCEIIIEVINKNPITALELTKSTLSFSGKQKNVDYSLSTEYVKYKEEYKLDEDNKINVSRKKWGNFKTMKAAKPLNTNFSINAVFDMPKYETEQFNITLDVKYQGKNIQLNLDPDVGACGTLSSANSYYTLNSSINVSGTCFTIGANNITLDGGGYTITGNSTGSGITTAGYDALTLKNFGGINNFTDGVYVTSTINSTIFNNTITSANKTGSSSGIYLASISNGNNISNNNITVHGRSNAFGIILASSQNNDNNIIYGNNVDAVGTANYGIIVQYQSDNTLVSANTVSMAGATSYGILFQTSYNNNVTNNTVTVTASSSSTSGIRLSGSSNNNISANTVISSGTTSNGIYLYSSADNNVLSTNTVTTSGSQGYGIYLETSTINNISANTINTTGSSAYGIYLLTTSNNNTIFDNTITASGSSGEGIRITTSSYNNLSANTIKTTHATTAYGVYLVSGIGNTFTNDNITATGVNDIRIASGSGTFTNVTFNTTDIGFDSGTSTGNLTVKWYVISNLSQTNGAALSSANVSGYNISNIIEQSAITGSNGLATLTLTEFEQNATLKLYHTPHSINATATNYLANSMTVNLTVTGSTSVVLSLTHICRSLTSSYTLDQNVNATGTCFTFGANNIVLDGGGYAITGNSSGNGITTADYDNLTIKNFAGINNFTNGIFGTGTVNSTIFNNTIVAANVTNGIGIYVFSSSNSNNISTNNITASGSSGYGIYIYSSSNNNTLTSNTVTTSGSNGYGIVLQTSSNNALFANTFKTTHATAAYGVYLYSGIANTFTDDNITSTGVNDIRIASGSGTFTNVTFNRTDIGFDSGAAGNLTVKWYVISNLSQTNGAALSSANVSGYNISNIIEQSAITGSNGLATLTLTEFEQNATLKLYHTPHSINASLAGYIANSTSVNLTVTGSTSVVLSLTHICRSLTSSYTLDQNVNATGTCFTIGANNIVLDGGGYIITGNSSGNGITTAGYDNITIKNFGGINNFSNGIYASGTVNATIFNNTIYPTAKTGFNYGISLASSSKSNNISNNKINLTGGNLARGIDLVTSSNDNIISLNDITTSNTNGYGITLSTSTNNILSANTITTTNLNGFGIYLLSTANNNNISANTITTSGDTSHGIRFDVASHNDMSANTIKTTSATTAYGVYLLSGGTNNTFTNDNITATGVNDIRISSGSGTFINVTFNKTDIGFDSGTSTGNLTVKWYLDVIVQNTSGTALQNANVSGYNISNIIEQSAITGSNGLATLTLTEFEQNATRKLYHTPHSINASLAGYYVNSTTVNFTVTSSTNVVLSLTPICRSLTSSYTLDQNVNVDGTCFTFRANDIILDGGGYIITGNSTGNGITTAGYDNITIKNFGGINNFTLGIFSSGTVNSTIFNNTIVGGDKVSYSYGISLASSSNSNNISTNTINVSSSLARGIDLVTSSNNNTISANIVTTLNSNGYGIFLSASNNNIISTNIVTTLNSNGLGIYLSVSSNNNAISTNTITTSSDGSPGIRLDTVSNNAISNNNIKTTHATTAYGVYLIGGTDNTFTNDNITATGVNDIRISSGSGTFINVTYNITDIGFDSGAKGNITVKWYLDVIVQNASGTALQNANVTIFNVSNMQQFNGLTAADGTIARQTLTDFFQDNASKTFHTPHTVNATLSGYNANSTTVNISSTLSTSTTLTLVNTPPSVIFNTPLIGYYNSNFVINATVTDIGGGSTSVVFYRYENSTTNGTYTQMTNSAGNYWNATFNISLVSNGNYTIRINATDINGNSNLTATVANIAIDTVNPIISYTTNTESNNTYFNRTWIFINVSANDTNEANITFFLYNSTAQVNATTSTAQLRAVNFTGLNSNEQYYYNVTLTDFAGNRNSTDTRKLTLDSTVPALSYTTNTESNNTYFNRTWIFINVSANDTNEANITFFLYNSTAQVNATTSTAQLRAVNFTGLNSNEQYYYNVTLTDFAGNRNSTDTRKLTLDSTVPALSYTTNTESDNTYFNRTWIFINVSANDTNEANITFFLYNSTAQVNATTSTAQLRAVNFTGLNSNEQYYYYNVSVQDSAGNLNTTVARKITLDSIAPSVNITFPITGSSLSSTQLNRTFNWSVSDVSLSVCMYSLNHAANITVPCLQNYTDIIVVTKAQNNITLYVNDSVGSINSASIVFRMNTKPQIPELISPANATEKIYTNLTFYWNASLDEDNDAVTYDIVLGNDLNFTLQLHNATTSNTNYTNTSIYQDGMQYWKVRAYDSLDYSNYSEARLIDLIKAVINITAPAYNSVVYPAVTYTLTVKELNRTEWIRNVTVQVLNDDIESVEQANLSSDNLTWVKTYTVPISLTPRTLTVIARAYNWTTYNYTNYTNTSGSPSESINATSLLKVTRIEGVAVSAPTITKLIPDPTNQLPNLTVNISLIVDLDTLLESITLNLTKPDSSSILLTANQTLDNSTAFIYYRNYTIIPDQLGIYSAKLTVIDINSQSANTSTAFRIANLVNHTLNKTNAINIKLIDINTKNTIVANVSNQSTIIPGQYDVEITTAKPTITFFNSTINETVKYVLNYTDLDENIAPPSGRRSAETFQIVSELAFSSGNVTFNYSPINASIVEPSNLEMYKCSSVSSCDWQKLTVSVDTTDKLITGLITNLSLFMVAEPTSPTTQTVFVSSGGGGATLYVQNKSIVTKAETLSLKIIVPSLLMLSSNESITTPVIIKNTGNLPLDNIGITSAVNTKDLSTKLDRTNLLKLEKNAQESVMLTISSHTDPGRYEITLRAVAYTQNIEDTAKIYIDLTEKGAGNKTNALSLLEFAKDLFNKNPECLELTELLKQSEVSLANKDYQKAEIMIDSAINACKELASLVAVRVEAPSKVNVLNRFKLYKLNSIIEDIKIKLNEKLPVLGSLTAVDLGIIIISIILISGLVVYAFTGNKKRKKGR